MDFARVVFLFTDIEGSTQLWQKHAAAMPEALARHDRMLSAVILDHGGSVIKSLGDGLMAVFTGGQPLHAALEIQRQLQAADWAPIEILRVRIGLHTGPAEQRGQDYFGLEVSRTARVMAAAWGGQVLLTPQVLETCPLPPGASIQNLGVHLLKDLFEPQAILGLVHPDVLSDFPPLRSLSAQPNNLPQQTTPFIGRQADLQTLLQNLAQPDCRLVTLTGPGGMGKTRLGIQAAAEAIGIFPQGVYFVPLAPLQSPGLVPGAIADALKYSFPQGAELETQLINYLASRRLLLVLDNFEHVIPAADFVTRLLAGAPQASLLVTSRERLNLQVECIYELGGLAAPTSPDATVFEDFEAVELFLAYARRAAPDVQLTPADYPAITTICRLVGGMPLGLQLAAGWARSLSLTEIAQELQEDIELLESTQRDLPERHRSMRAVFEYSWNLLDPQERAAFAALSIFRGGFTRPAAKAVCSLSTPVLTRLVDKSLVQHDSSGRYQVHELLRQLAAEKLAENPAAAAQTAERHARHFASWVENQIPKWSMAQAARDLDNFDEEIDNLRQSSRWAFQTGAWEYLRQQNIGWMIYGQLRSKYMESYQFFSQSIACLDRLLQAGGQDAETLAQQELTCAELLVNEGWFLLRLGRLEAALAAAKRSRAIFQRLPRRWRDIPGTDPLLVEAIIASVHGDFEQAVSLGKAAYQAALERDEPSNRAEACYTLIGALAGGGHFAEALEYGAEGLRLLDSQVNFPWFRAYLLNEMGLAWQSQERYAEAQACFAESRAIRSRFNDPEGMAVTALHLGQLAWLQGDRSQARQDIEQALATYREIGDPGGRARALLGLGQLALDEQNWATARRCLQEALRMAVEIQFVPVTLAILVEVGILWLRTGGSGRAGDKLRTSPASSDTAQPGLALLAEASAHPSLPQDARRRGQAAIGGAALPPASRTELFELARAALAQLA